MERPAKAAKKASVMLSVSSGRSRRAGRVKLQRSIRARRSARNRPAWASTYRSRLVPVMSWKRL